MNYILSSLLDEGVEVNVLSLGESALKTSSTLIQVCDRLSVTYVGTFPRRNRLTACLSRVWLLLQVIWYLLTKVSSGESVIVYHSRAITPAIWLAKCLIPELDIIYEVEEIYAAAWRWSENRIEKELSGLLFVDKYIVVNDILADIIRSRRPTAQIVICYGVYKMVTPVSVESKSSATGGRIVYAGGISGTGSDVYLAIDAMRFLPDCFTLSIVGYGEEADLELLRTYIASDPRIRYDGLLSGKEYESYLSEHDIGLNPRVLEDQLSDYTFPSKVLVYLTHNLRTVSTPISCIKESKVASLIDFASTTTPEGLAKAILCASDRDVVPIANLIQHLDREFKAQLIGLLQHL